MDNCIVGNCCVLSLFTLLWVGSNQNSLIQLLIPSTPVTMHCLCPLSYLTQISVLWQWKTLSFPLGDMGLMKTDCKSGNAKQLPRFKISGKNLSNKNWLQWNCDHRDSLGKAIILSCSFSDCWVIMKIKKTSRSIRCQIHPRKTLFPLIQVAISQRGQLIHAEQLDDGASPQRDVTPPSNEDVPALLFENSHDSPIAPLLDGAWEILFCHQPTSNRHLANVTTNSSCRVSFGLRGWSCGQVKS